jgi:hypothetical protein
MKAQQPTKTHCHACYPNARTHARTHTSVCSQRLASPTAEASIASAGAMRCVCDGAASLCSGTTCGIQHERWDRQRMRDSMRHANVRDATGKRRVAARSVQRTRCDVGQATGSAPHATWDRGTGIGERAACNGERAATTRKGQRASDQCNRQQKACAIPCDNQCATRHTRTPRTRCNITIRAVPQQARRAHGTDNTQQAMQCTR